MRTPNRKKAGPFETHRRLLGSHRRNTAGLSTLRCAAIAMLPFLLIHSLGNAQEPPPKSHLQLEWQAIQANRDQRVRKDWWQDLDLERLIDYLDAGAGANISDSRGWTPLHSAARFNPYPDVLNALLQAGASVNARDRAGDTPLHWAAAENPNVEVVNSLIMAGAEVNATDRFGWTPLHTAAESNPNPEVIEALMSAGAKRTRRAYFILFAPTFLLKHNSNMSQSDKETAMALLKGAE